MSIDHPRRIFRRSKRVSLPSLASGLMVLIVGGGVAAMSGLPGSLLGQRTPDAVVIAAGPSEVSVIDGDTLRLDGIVLRLDDVVAPSRGEACAAGPDCGGRATAVLAELVRDRSVRCSVLNHDGMGRPAARCLADGRDVNLAMVASGWARVPRYDSVELEGVESDARAHGRGMWLAK